MKNKSQVSIRPEINNSHSDISDQFSNNKKNKKNKSDQGQL